MSAVIHFIASLLVFNRLTPGRAQFALKGMRAAATPAELAVIGPFLDEAAEQARVTGRMNRAWRAARKLPKGRTGVQAVDARVDGALGSLYNPLDRAARFLPEGHPIKTQAADLLLVHCPDGLGAMTSLPYEEELDEVEGLVEALSAEALQPLVQQLGLSVWLEVLRALLPEYDAAMRAHAGRPLTYAQVRAARAELQEAIARVRVVILGHWPRANEAEIRERLLAPLQQQSDDVGAAVRQQVRALDVHPETGAPVESDEEVEAGAPT